MAIVSKRIRKERRQRRNATLVKRAYRQSIAQSSQHLSILLAILATRGGDVIVNQQAIDTVAAKLHRLGYAIVAAKEPDVFLVTMIEQTEATDASTSGTSQTELSPSDVSDVG